MFFRPLPGWAKPSARRARRLLAPVLAIVCIAAPASARRVFPQNGSPVAQCEAAAAAAGALEDIPDGLMARIALAETGRRDIDGAWRPWPWSIDADGEDVALFTQPQAVAWAEGAPRRGVRLMDVGCLQVNLQFHSHAFATLRDAFDPWDNALFAATYLRALHDSDAGGDWAVAVGMYHSHTPELAMEYRTRIAELGAGIIAGITPGPLLQRMQVLGLLRLRLSNGRTLRLILNRQPAAPGHRRPSACQVAAALAPELAVPPHPAGCRRR